MRGDVTYAEWKREQAERQERLENALTLRMQRHAKAL